jgi:hypothetical protein
VGEAGWPWVFASIGMSQSGSLPCRHGFVGHEKTKVLEFSMVTRLTRCSKLEKQTKWSFQ